MLETPLINCKVELKLIWTNHCILAIGNIWCYNDDDAISNITFTVKDSKLYVPLVTSSTKHNQKLSKLLNKGFERSAYQNEYKTKNENEDTTRRTDVLLDHLVEVNRLLVLVYSNQDDKAKSYN